MRVGIATDQGGFALKEDRPKPSPGPSIPNRGRWPAATPTLSSPLIGDGAHRIHSACRTVYGRPTGSSASLEFIADSGEP
jgi:hypothetical protein